MTHAVVYLLDVDNTLFDNDRFASDLTERLNLGFGAAGAARYWQVYGRRREQLGYADYLGALEEFRNGQDLNPRLAELSTALLNYPFHRNLYPRALETVSRLRARGRTVIFSDGDIVFQPHKIQRSGLWEAVAGHVLVSVHKEQALDAMQRAYPGGHYVMVDDKPRLLCAMKQAMGQRLTTVFVRQGHHASEAAGVTLDPPPDHVIDRIADLNVLCLPELP